jgi:allantoin racemase
MPATKRLLLINPNTSESVTRQLGLAAAPLTPPEGQVLLRTARFGLPYISSEYGLALAGHAVLDVFNAAMSEPVRPNVVLLGCFGDPGLLALREHAGLPVAGLAEAAMREAAERGRYAIVTGGAAWVPMLRRLAWSLDLLEPLAGIVTVEPTGAELAADPAMAGRVLRQACAEAAALPGVQSMVIGGAALAGWAARLQPEFGLPLLDSVDCGLRAAWHMTCV